MTEPTELHGLEGLRAALECPEEWEGREVCYGWVPHGVWKDWASAQISSENRRFRRIEKPREAETIDKRVTFYLNQSLDMGMGEKGIKM